MLRKILGILAVVAGICSAAEPTPVILISIDTLRADHLSAYGYRRIHTPNIDSFAQQGTVFTNVDAQVPLTLPSHTSLFTSTYPFQNQIEENAERVSPSAVTLASVLRGHGYKTAAFIGSVFLESEMRVWTKGSTLYDSPFISRAFSPISGSMFLRSRQGTNRGTGTPGQRPGAGRGQAMAGVEPGFRRFLSVRLHSLLNFHKCPAHIRPSQLTMSELAVCGPVCWGILRNNLMRDRIQVASVLWWCCCRITERGLRTR